MVCTYQDDGGDDVCGKRALRVAISLLPQQHGQQVVAVVVVVLLLASLVDGRLLADDLGHDVAHGPVAPLGLPQPAAEPAHQRRRRVQVGQVEIGRASCRERV